MGLQNGGIIMSKTILLVDDEQEIREINRRYLVQEGYQVIIASDGKEALQSYKTQVIDLVISDIMMPNMDGYDFISEVQTLTPEQPFLFITAKTTEADKIYSLSIGADDYILKPFSPRELVLRVNNILRRIYSNKSEADKLVLGDLEIDYRTRLVKVNQKELNLTIKEFDLLWILAKQPQQVFSKTELYEKVWKEDFMDDTNTLNVHIHALRHALLDNGSEKTPSIKTVWGLGYKIEV